MLTCTYIKIEYLELLLVSHTWIVYNRFLYIDKNAYTAVFEFHRRKKFIKTCLFVKTSATQILKISSCELQ